MPNPFPGMDPYLENPIDWEGFHTALMTHMAEAIRTVLPASYVAKVEARCLIEHSEGVVKPDIAVMETSRPSVLGASGRVAVLERTEQSDPALHLRVFPLEERQTYLNILDRRGRQVVTTIEILSPTNKNTRDNGFEAYRRKQREVLASQASLLEIDLLRGGTHTVAVPVSVLPDDLHWDYLSCLHRGGRGYEYEVWPVSLRQSLPRISVPLGEGDPDIVLDLQALLTQTYEAGFYDNDLNYTMPPTPPLAGDDANWADALLRERGLRL